MSEDSSSSNRSYTINAVASSVAAACGRLACHPIDTIKSKLQATESFRGIRDVVSTTLRNEGLVGLYRGIGAVMVGGIPGCCVYFTTYDYCKDQLLARSGNQKWYEMAAFFSSGMIAESICCSIFIPVDVVKERLQVQQERKAYNYKGTFDALRTIIREEGVAALYRGYFATLLSYGPFSAVYFLLYEKMKSYKQQSKADAGNSSGTKASLDFYEKLTISAAAGSVASFITNPLDLAKLRIQIQQSNSVSAASVAQVEGTVTHYRSFFHALTDVYQRRGITGLFRGAGSRLLFHTPCTAITMALYEEFKVLGVDKLK